MQGRVPKLIGRLDEQRRLTRIISRNLNNNAILIGPAGVGKTALLRGWVAELSKDQQFSNLPFIELSVDSFAETSTPALFTRINDGLMRLPVSVVLIDDFGQLVTSKQGMTSTLFRLLKVLLGSPKVRLVLSMTPQELQTIEREGAHLLDFFEKVDVKAQDDDEQVLILKAALKKFQKTNPVLSSSDILKNIVTLSTRFPRLGQIPKASIQVLDEALALARLEKRAVLTEKHIFTIIADKAGIPLSQLMVSETEKLKKLEPELSAKIIGQWSAINTITSIITRAKLGLKNPNRPLGSFLVLGPSGVGKTETAKLLAELVYGKKESFLRLDMSEFAESHTTQRLLGAPAGYVGFDAGGGLTNPIKREPYSLILLDEVEKAHPKVFDIFLQVLDDGRLTSGAGETVDFTQTIIMATSNIGVDAILEGHDSYPVGSPKFIEKFIMPDLIKFFRLEFINRFDAIVVFSPLNENDLLKIAQLEIKKVEKRAEKFGISFDLDVNLLREQMDRLADPRFGARPIKRYIEETCENLIADALLQQQ